jgi:hypothetical protein
LDRAVPTLSSWALPAGAVSKQIVTLIAHCLGICEKMKNVPFIRALSERIMMCTLPIFVIFFINRILEHLSESSLDS